MDKKENFMAGKYINILLGLLTIFLSACSDDRDSLSGQAGWRSSTDVQYDESRREYCQ